MRYLRTNTATRITVGPFQDKTDGVTAEVALTVTGCKLTFMVDTAGVPTLIIDAAATASGGDNDMVHITGDDAGFYDLELTAAQTNYLGRAMLAITDAATHCPVFHEFMILPANVYDSMVLGTDVLNADITEIGGVAQSATDLKHFVDSGYDPATSKVQGVVLVDTTTTNTDMRGTNSAALANVCTETRLANLNAAISSRSSHSASDIWAVGTRTLTSFGTLVADVWAYSSRTLTAFSTALALSVWDVLESAITMASSIGLKLKTNLDAKVSEVAGASVTVLPFSGSIQASYAKDGITTKIVQGDSPAIPYDLATNLTGWTVWFAVKKDPADATYAVAVKEITSSVTDFVNGRGTIPLTTAETDLDAGYYFAEVEIRKASDVITALKFTMEVRAQVVKP